MPSDHNGFRQSDVDTYFKNSSLKTFPLPLRVKVVGPAITTSPGLEADLDVQMVLSMAPGAQVYAFTGSLDRMLQHMADHPEVLQLSSSYFYKDIDSIAIHAAQQFALQGQSLFESSGDSGGQGPSQGYTDLRAQPTVTNVGGTEINIMSSDGAFSYTETAWKGSQGGIMSRNAIPIPFYQIGLANSANLASSVFRNTPDVSAEAEKVGIYITKAKPSPAGELNETASGTSASAPLWAGFTALVNQTAKMNGEPSVGFVNPALYRLANQPGSYAADFDDVMTGSSDNKKATLAYSATQGYDSRDWSRVAQVRAHQRPG